MDTFTEANGKERIISQVPDGFPSMSEPVKEEQRFGSDEIRISIATEDDLPDVAEGLFNCFPEVWWSTHEPPETRPSPEARRALWVKRLTPAFRYPGFVPVKASLKSTGEFAGFAGWFKPSEALFDDLNGQWIGAFRYAAWKDKPNGLGFQTSLGLSDDEVAKLWQYTNKDSWEGEFAGYDKVRTEEMGKTPHWYLAPLFVREKFRGRGVGRLLLDYAAKQADKQTPPTPLYLEALPNARPVYLHCGYTTREGEGRSSVMIRNGP